ncbi:MAG TPA: hypothetical protein VMH35_11640 [Streptosporangiaceae bacterium]|nr:hypothetical protein [Streptosporangiaceae bacterium]
MFLLVIGLVAVIVAFLVAAFFSMRRRHDDEDEPGRRLGVRDRLPGRGQEAGGARWDPGAAPQARPGRRPGGRVPAPSRRPGRDSRGFGHADHYEGATYDQSRGYEPSPRGYGERTPVRGYNGQGGERTPSARHGSRYDDATETVVQSAARPARRGQATPSAPNGGDSFGTGPVAALYDTGPVAAAPGGYATAQADTDPDLADSDVFPRVRGDDPPPAGQARPRNQPKLRGGRPSRSKHDDDDWPSTEWDKLSDEQYWAELSADKPLATTARSAQSSSPAPAAGQPARTAAARPARPRPARGRAAAADDRTASRRGHDRAGQEDATQQLDAASASWSGGRPPATRPRGTRPPEAPDRDGRAAGPRPGGRTGRSGSGHDYDAAQRMPARDWQRAAASLPSAPVPAQASSVSTGPIGTGPVSPADPAPRRSTARRAADDDPLTSPAFARDTSPARDSRAYRGPGHPARREPARGSGPETRGYQGGPDRAAYPAPADPGSYPGQADRPHEYRSPASRHGYPAAGERTDPNAIRPTWDDEPNPAETTSPQAGAGNPYGSFVDSTPLETTGPSYPLAPQAASVPSGYGPGPAGEHGPGSGYPDPYAPGRDGYPVAASQRSHGRHDQGTTWYSAPPAATSQPPAAHPYPAAPGGYPDGAGYRNGSALPDRGPYPRGTARHGGGSYPEGTSYPPSTGYSASHSQHARPGDAGYGTGYGRDRQSAPRYPGGPGTDPYGPGGYGGYHSGQG